MPPRPLLLLTGAVLLICLSGLVILRTTNTQQILKHPPYKIARNRLPVYLASVPPGLADTSKCRNNNLCVPTDDPNSADLVIINLHDYVAIGKPPTKQPGQLFIGATLESQFISSRMYDPKFAYLLDGWAFYSRQASIYKPWFPCSAGARIEDSDVGKPVRILGDRLSDFQTPFDAAALVNRSRHVSALAQGHNRTAEVASFVSYCPPRYGGGGNNELGVERYYYIKQLMTFIDVDNYGLCLRNVKLKPSARSIKERVPPSASFAAVIDAMKSYPFTLVFENTVASEWVTEKIFNALAAGSLPVYWGTTDVYHLLPCKNCIIFAMDFATPYHLAEYLKFLLATPAEYLSYFEWKKEPNKLLPSFVEQWKYCENNEQLRLACMVCDRLLYMRHFNLTDFHNSVPPQQNFTAYNLWA